MSKIEIELRERKEKLEQVKHVLQKRDKKRIEGELRVNGSRENAQYFHVLKDGKAGGTYIPKKNLDLAKSLAQNNYEQKVIQSVEQEIRAIETYLAALPKVKPENIYETLHLERQKLIVPICETDEQYIRNWEQIPYQGKRIDDTVPVIVSMKGERVRSKSEMIIADALYAEGIPYKYECPIYLKGYGTVYPDFTVLNIRKRKIIYWEHLGLMDDSGYVENTLSKINHFERNGHIIGDDLILTWETKNHPLTQADIKRKIEQYFS